MQRLPADEDVVAAARQRESCSEFPLQGARRRRRKTYRHRSGLSAFCVRVLLPVQPVAEVCCSVSLCEDAATFAIRRRELVVVDEAREKPSPSTIPQSAKQTDARLKSFAVLFKEARPASQSSKDLAFPNSTAASNWRFSLLADHVEDAEVPSARSWREPRSAAGACSPIERRQGTRYRHHPPMSF